MNENDIRVMMITHFKEMERVIESMNISWDRIKMLTQKLILATEDHDCKFDLVTGEGHCDNPVHQRVEEKTSI